MTGADLPLFSRCLGAWVDPSDVFVTLYASDENSFWLDREAHPSERFSIMGHASGGRVLNADQLFERFAKPLSELSEVAEVAEDVAQQESLPFSWRPGYVGWFDYQSDTLAPDTLKGTWLFAKEALVLDHRERKIWLVGEFESQAEFTEWVNAALIRLGLSGGQRIGYLHRHTPRQGAQLISMAHQPGEYESLVEQARQHIAAGDVYQICLTNRLDLHHVESPLAVFLRLRALNPAPYACYMRNGDVALVSASPEQFLTVTRDGQATTRPIKGTRPRSFDQVLDRKLADELAEHPKELAENLMIVDLMRNDLTKVAQPQTVEVSELFGVEAHPSVHQLVSTVSAKLATDTNLESLIRAVFPGGSMTGAPKIRAMQLISVLEQVPRGIYSGVAGYIGSDGTVDLGMIIRSIVFEGDRASIGVGGGITIDSDPSAEVAETALKAEALLRVLGVADPWV